MIFLLCGFQFQAYSGQDFGRLPLRECWSFGGETLSLFGIASDNAQQIFIPHPDGLIKSIEKHSGKSLWFSEIGGEISSPVLTEDDTIYVVSRSFSLPTEKQAQKGSSGAFSIHALSVSTGISLWQKSLEHAAGEKVHLLTSSEKIVAITDDGKFTAFKKRNGELLTERKHNIKVGTVPSLLEGKIYLGTDKGILIFGESTFDQIGEIKTKNTPTVILPAEKDSIYAGDDLGNVLSLSLEDRDTRWKTWTGAEITSITSLPEGILVSSLDNYVYLLSRKNGKRLWKKRLSGRSIGAPLVRQGVGVFSTQGGNEAVFIELQKGRLINQVNLPDENFFISNPVALPAAAATATTGSLVIFQTHKGIFAFGSERDCPPKNQAVKGK